jgi:hypothetical protein
MKSWNLELQLNDCVGVDVDGVVAAVDEEVDPIPSMFCIMLGTNEVEVVELVAVVGVWVVLAPRPRRVCDQAGAETPSATITTASHLTLRIRSPFSRMRDLRATGIRLAEWRQTITTATTVSRPSFGSDRRAPGSRVSIIK